MLIETHAHAHQIEATYCITSVIILSGQVAMISHYTVVSKSITQIVQTMMSSASDKKERISQYANLYPL